MKSKMIGAFVCLCALVLPGSAQAFITKFTISHKHPYVDESEVVVTWRADRTLKSGYHYEGWLLDPQGERGCATSVRAKTSRHIKKAHNVSLTFNSLNDHTQGPEGYYEWCDGKATFTISVVKNGAEEGSGTIIGGSSFRFYKKP